MTMMFNDEYRYGKQIGMYQANYEIIINLINDIDKELLKKKQRIKWLSNHELEMLRKVVMKYYRMKFGNKEEEQRLYEIKKKILTILA